MNIVNRIINYFSAGYPCLVLPTSEELRAQRDVIEAAKKMERNIFTWSATEGVRQVHPTTSSQSDTQELQPALGYLMDIPEKSVILLRDPHQWGWESQPVLSRYLRDLITIAPSKESSVVIIAPDFKPWSAIEKLITVVDYELPDLKTLREIGEATARNNGVQVEITDAAVKALVGMSTTEAENACALSLVEAKTFDTQIIYREKVAAVKRTGRLEIVEPDPAGLENIGGLAVLKDWILKRKKSYSPAAEKYGLPSPKGVLLVGIPGSGKSLSAKAIGTALGVPTLRLDISALFGGIVGESERNTRDALALAEAMSPCVIWADEVDKGLSGSKGSGENDSGTTRRVFGLILTWLQEKKAPVFCCMTANQLESLPPEFLRKGRFDEIFAIDLPTAEEREQIAAIILKNKKRRDIENFDLKKIAMATENYTGSEIEAAIGDAMFNAFDDNGREFTTADIVLAAQQTVPLSKTASEQIDAIRKWAADGRARMASAPAEKCAPTMGGRKIKV